MVSQKKVTCRSSTYCVLMIFATEHQGAPAQQAVSPSPSDMAEAKVLYVKLKAKWDSGVEGCPTKIEDLRCALGDGGLTKPWSGMTGLRHK